MAHYRDVIYIFIGILLAQLWTIVHDVFSHRSNGNCAQKAAKYQQIHAVNLTICTVNAAPLLHVIADAADNLATTLRVRLLPGNQFQRSLDSSCGQLVATRWSIYTLTSSDYDLQIREEYRTEHAALADLVDVPLDAVAPPFIGRVVAQSPVHVPYQPATTFACVGRLYSHVYMYGDSTVRHLFQHLDEAPRVSSFQPPRHEPLQFPQQHSVLARFLAAHPRPLARSALVFDFAGLWNVAYGQLQSYDRAFPEALASLRQHSKRWKLFWLSTVAVHPIHFAAALLSGHDANGRSKWQMTAPRVTAMNAIARKHIAQHNLRFPEQRVRVLDLWPLTHAREDDPKTPTDMRHYGADTYHRALQLISARMCGAEFLD